MNKTFINYIELIERSDKDIPLTLLILETYCRDFPEYINQLGKSIKDCNWEETAKLAHKIKGSSQTVSAPKLVKHAILIENSLKESRTENLTSLLQDIQTDYKTTFSHIQDVIKVLK